MARTLALVVALFGLTSSAFAQWTLNKIDLTNFPMAVCLDGTPGAYYFSPGSGSGVNSWEIQFMGGGWCTSEQDCLARAQGVNAFGASSLGGSAGWGTDGCPNDASPVCTMDGAAGGMASRDQTVNPFSYNWNKVYVGYCDGGSFAGTVTDPVYIGDSDVPIYYRGRYILDAVVETLLANGLSTATDVILKGNSAGGLSVYLHADYLSRKIQNANPAAKVSAAAGAGFFVDSNNIDGVQISLPLFKWIYANMNVSGSVNGECMITYVEAPYRCLYAPDNLPFIHTPLFIANSLADRAQFQSFINLDCDPSVAGNCNSRQMAAVNQFRDTMLDRLAGVVNSEFGGAFLPECYLHNIQDVDAAWNGIQVQGQTQVQTFTSWYANNRAVPGVPLRLEPLAVERVVYDGAWGSNPSCALYPKSQDTKGLSGIRSPDDDADN